MSMTLVIRNSRSAPSTQAACPAAETVQISRRGWLARCIDSITGKFGFFFCPVDHRLGRVFSNFSGTLGLAGGLGHMALTRGPVGKPQLRRAVVLEGIFMNVWRLSFSSCFCWHFSQGVLHGESEEFWNSDPQVDRRGARFVEMATPFFLPSSYIKLLATINGVTC